MEDWKSLQNCWSFDMILKISFNICYKIALIQTVKKINK